MKDRRNCARSIRVVGTVFSSAVAAGIAAAALVVFEGDLKWANDDMNENVYIYIYYIHIYMEVFQNVVSPPQIIQVIRP